MFTISNVSKLYSKGFYGIKDFCLNIQEGEIVCIAGPNGSGKTTLINCINEVINKTSGSIELDGFLSSTIEFKSRVGYVADDTLLIDALTGNEYIDFIGSMYNLEDDTKKKKLISLFSMSDFLNRPISTYSHGMKKKIQIICAFMIDCKMLILDEPLRGLDIESILSLKKLLFKHKKNGCSILMSSHDLISAETFCDKFVIISQGTKISEGTAEELKLKYNTDSLENVFAKSALSEERRQKVEEIINNL